MSANPSSPERAPFVPNYSLEQPELLDLERQMAEYAQDVHHRQGVHALLIDPTHPFSNFIRTQEEIAFPGAGTELSWDAELDTRQLALIDTRRKSRTYGNVAFISTVSGFRGDRQGNPNTTGVVAVDELISIPENNLTVEAFRQNCLENGIDPNKVIGVETSVKLVKHMEKFHMMRTVPLAYMAIFNLGLSMKPSVPNQHLAGIALARVNPTTETSTKRTFIKSEPLMGRTDWITPERELAEPYDPVVYNSRKHRAITALRLMGPKIIVVGAE